MRPWSEGLKHKAQGLSRKWSESTEGLNRKLSGIWGRGLHSFTFSST